MSAMLEVRDLVRRYGTTTVLHGVSLSLEAGGALGIVGGSGSGKSTLARTVLGLEPPQGGSVMFARRALAARPRGAIQAVFQDPYGSLDPRMRGLDIVAEPLLALRPRPDAGERSRRAAAMIEAVALPDDARRRFPHEFSGGQRQRLAIARALVSRPSLVVADEPVSALDVSVQAQVLALIRDLRARFGLAWLFISHDLAVVRAVTDSVVVLCEGRVVEQGPSADIFLSPRHPYTRALLAAVTAR
jgi:peptide/nickel transport system ATP-binding protein